MTLEHFEGPKVKGVPGFLYHMRLFNNIFLFFRSNTLKSVRMELLSASYTSNVVPIIWATFWVISESLFLGSTHGIPGSWHPFFDVISESVLLISTLWLDIRLLAYSFIS